MKIHLRQIPADGLHFEGEEECPIADLADEGVVCAGPLRYTFDVGISEGALWAQGKLSQPLELKCVACLETFVHVVDVPEFALHTELHGPELIDLTPFMREDILLNLPAYPRCDRTGERVCPAPQLQRDESDAAEAARKPDWSALDQLDL
ncbi:MAG: YceD family protein [Chthoniobacterales bacterium]